jgi:hypothetical protein
MFFYVAYKLLTKGVRGMDALTKPSHGLEQFRAKHKILYYLPIASYLIVFFAALLWMMYEVLVRYLNIDTLGLLWSGSIVICVVVAASISTALYLRGVLQRLPPRPEPGSSENVILEWQNRYVDEAEKHLLRVLIRTWLIGMGIIIVFIGVLVIVLYLR